MFPRRHLLGLLRLRRWYLPLLLLLCALHVWHPFRTTEDFWAHAAVGRWIWQHQDVPRETLFLWSASKPWVAHSWLSELTFFGLATLDGQDDSAYLILAFTIVLVAVPFALAWWLWGRRMAISSWMLIPFVLAFDVSETRFRTRPELFTALLLALLLALLVTWPAPNPGAPCKRRSGWRPLSMVLLFILWANFHGAVVVGILILAVTAVCDLCQDRCNQRSRRLAVLTCVCLAAVCVNPFGLRYWHALVPVRGPMFAHIMEWKPLWKLPAFPTEMVAGQAAILAVALLAWTLNPQRRWAHLAWLLFMTLLFANAVRNIWLLAITSLFVLAANGQGMTPDLLWRKVTQFRRAVPDTATPPLALRWLVRGGLVAWIVMGVLTRLGDLQFSATGTAQLLRQGAVHFIRTHPCSGHLLNDYENSGYLEWQLGGQPPLFIDLLNAYPDPMFFDHAEMMHASRRGRALLEQYQIRYVLLTIFRQGPSLSGLANFLDRDPGWVRVYTGLDGAVWVRRTAEYEPLWRGQTTSQPKPFGVMEFLRNVYD